MAKSKQIKDEVKASATTLYEAISHEGREEMERPMSSLAWSGLIAGMLISFCLICEAILKLHLPDWSFAPLIYNLGYSVGFVLVIIGRFQLFTENTITPILPLYNDFTRNHLIKTARLWSIVLACNLIGTFIIACLIAFVPYISTEFAQVMVEVSRHAVSGDFLKVFILAIPAGFLIAALVWFLPNAPKSKIFLIFLITYVIALLDFAHVVAGSTEAFLLVLKGQISVLETASFITAATLGNIVGGTFLFSLVAYAQVRKELD